MLTNKQKFNKLMNNPLNASNSIEYIAEKMKVEKKDLLEVIHRGKGAYLSNPGSVRPHVTSAIQWGYSRMYAFIKHVIMIRKNKDYKPNSDNDLVQKYA